MEEPPPDPRDVTRSSEVPHADVLERVCNGCSAILRNRYTGETVSINCSAVCHYSGPFLYLCDADGSTVWASRLFKWSAWEDSESKRWFLVHVHSDGIERKWLSPLMQMFFLKDNPNLNIDATIVSSKGSIFFSLTILEGLCSAAPGKKLRSWRDVFQNNYAEDTSRHVLYPNCSNKFDPHLSSTMVLVLLCNLVNKAKTREQRAEASARLKNILDSLLPGSWSFSLGIGEDIVTLTMSDCSFPLCELVQHASWKQLPAKERTLGFCTHLQKPNSVPFIAERK